MATQMTQVSAMMRNMQRRLRRPQHRFNLKTKPWQLQPFLIAPVLPGETLKKGLLQARVVSDPIVDPLVGWWKEYYFFYVKHRDLAIRDDCESMVLDPSFDMAGTNGEAAAAVYYHGEAGTMNWAYHCLKEVTEWYFRAEGEAWNIVTSDNLPVVNHSLISWLDSAIDDTEWQAIDQAIAVDATPTPDEVSAGDTELALIQYNFLKEMSLVDMDYEEFLKTYGVRVPERELHKPELIRYVRQWTYPVNTVDPTDGDPSSAVSWSIRERMDKDRFFSEPGFIFGCTCARPKIYFTEQDGSMVDYLDDVYTWLPGLLTNEPRSRMRQFTAGTGPLQSNTDGYWVDVADLFLYGDQFFNHTSTKNGVALPTATMNKKYPTEAMGDALFVDSTGASDLWWLREDGVVNLMILSSLQDTSRTTDAKTS